VSWYACTVNEVGPASDSSDTPGPAVYINLTDTAGSFANTWVYASHRKFRRAFPRVYSGAVTNSVCRQAV
jgi:hypothetical protein